MVHAVYKISYNYADGCIISLSYTLTLDDDRMLTKYVPLYSLEPILKKSCKINGKKGVWGMERDR